MASVKSDYYEYIVIGCGGIGSATLYWLSKRQNAGVLGLEQFSLAHDKGGSQDYSRIIRLHYTDEVFVRLMPAAYKALEDVERESGLQLIYKTGCVEMGVKEHMGHVVDTYAQAMEKCGIDFERLDGEQICKRFPQFNFGPEVTGVYQKDGGLVDAAMSNSVHLQLARANGANVIDNCPVTRLGRDSAGRILVYTTKGVFTCRRVIVTAGAWLNTVLGSIGVHVPVNVTQEQVSYFATPHPKDFTKDKFPVYIFHTPDFDIYGFPIHGVSGTKIGLDAAGPVVTADTRTFEPDPERHRIAVEFMKKCIPKALGPVMSIKTCLYTITFDRYFLIDSMKYNGWPEVIACCGAGHAFKFVGIFGKILTDLAVDGKTSHPIDAFKFEREAILNPDYKPVRQMITVRETAAKL